MPEMGILMDRNRFLMNKIKLFKTKTLVVTEEIQFCFCFISTIVGYLMPNTFFLHISSSISNNFCLA